MLIRLAATLTALALAAAPGWAAPAGYLEHQPLSAEQLRALFGTAGQEITLAQARAHLLELTNIARDMAEVPRVVGSPAADELAQRHAEELAAGHFASHYDLAGRKCELRYNVLGQADHVEENVCYYEVEAAVCLTGRLVVTVFDDWRASAAHDKNLLTAEHTYVGIGFAVLVAEGVSYVAAVQEFVNDYGSYSPLPACAAPGDALTLSLSLDPTRAMLACVAVGREELPAALTPAEALMRGRHYAQPEPFIAYPYLPATELRLAVPLADSYVFFTGNEPGSVSLPLRIGRDWAPGAYYITAWVVPVDGGDPFRAMTQVVLVGE